MTQERRGEMPDPVEPLIEKLRAAGWSVRLENDLLTAEKRVILARWLLGSRRVDHRLRIRADASARSMTLQEIAKESVVGIAPPSFSVTVTRQDGLEVTEQRTDRSLGGGGHLHYGKAREWLEDECAKHGWTLVLSVGSP